VGAFDVGGNDIADRFDFDAVDHQIIRQMGRSHAADADEADADPFDGLDLELRAGLARAMLFGCVCRVDADQGGAQAGNGPGFEKGSTAFERLIHAAIIVHGWLLIEKRRLPA
jgi:hypothetical protein